jgi:HD-like signal output (HDOD) protein
MKEIDLETAKKMVAGINIPPRPTALIAILEEKQAREPNLNRISDAISTDVGLSASVLKAVNSPLYGLKTQVNSVPHAVSLLGLKNILTLVTGLSLRQSIQGKKQASFERFWDAAANTALVARALSRDLIVGDPDDAYLIGLFHDCGIPLMMMKFKGYIPVLKQANSNPATEVTVMEDDAFSTNHSIVGYMVAHTWGLPQQIAEVIKLHHEDLEPRGEAEHLTPMVYLLAMAEHISNRVSSLALDIAWERSKGKILAFFELSAYEFDELVFEMESQLME